MVASQPSGSVAARRFGPLRRDGGKDEELAQSRLSRTRTPVRRRPDRRSRVDSDRGRPFGRRSGLQSIDADAAATLGRAPSSRSSGAHMRAATKRWSVNSRMSSSATMSARPAAASCRWPRWCRPVCRRCSRRLTRHCGAPGRHRRCRGLNAAGAAAPQRISRTAWCAVGEVGTRCTTITAASTIAAIHISPRNIELTDDQLTNSSGCISSFHPRRFGSVPSGEGHLAS